MFRQGTFSTLVVTMFRRDQNRAYLPRALEGHEIFHSLDLTECLSLCWIGSFTALFDCTGGSGSVVEHHLAKVRVASSNLVFRSTNTKTRGLAFAGPLCVCGQRDYGVRGYQLLQLQRKAAFVQDDILAGGLPSGEPVAAGLASPTDGRANTA